MAVSGFPGGASGKNSPANAGESGSIPALGRSPGVVLPGKSHGQRSLAGYTSIGSQRI